VTIYNDSPEVVFRIETKGPMDRAAIEALYLEVRQLAKQYGVEIKKFHAENAADDATDFVEGQMTGEG